jgi:hypothetical protein
VADDRSETPPKDDFKRPQMSVPDEKLEAQPKAPEPESPLRSGDPVIPDEPAMPPAAAAAEPAFDPEPSMDKAPSRLRSWLKPAQGGEQAASAPDAETPAAQAAGPAPEPEEVTAYEHDVPALDPVDLERALRDFRDVPEDVLRADAGWHNDAPDDEQDALDDHEEPVAPAAYSSAATGYTAAAYAAPSRGAPEASAEAAGGTRPDTYGEFDPVDPYDDPAFSDLDEDDYESDATAGESAYHEAPPEPYMSGDAIEEAVDERVDMGEAMAFQHAAANEEKPRRRGTFFAVGILLGLVILGGGFAYVMSGTAPQEEGEAPILRADTKPSKIEPEDPGGANIPNQDRLVFDRVSGEASGGKEQLVSREEEIIEPAGGQGEANSGMAQSGSGTSSSSGAASPSPGNSQAVLSPNGSSAGVPLAPVPRRVKTMVVRPDGSIVAAEPEPMRTASEPVATPAPAAPAPAPTSSEQMTASSESAQGEKTAERAVSALDNGASSSGAVPAPPSRPESTSESTSSGASTSSSVTPVRPVRGAPMPLNPNPVPRRTAESGSSSTATPAPTPAPEASTSVSRQVASATPRSAPAPSSSGQYVVQLAARKNEEQAQGAYNALKAKYGSLLNRYSSAPILVTAGSITGSVSVRWPRRMLPANCATSSRPPAWPIVLSASAEPAHSRAMSGARVLRVR